MADLNTYPNSPIDSQEPVSILTPDPLVDQAVSPEKAAVKARELEVTQALPDRSPEEVKQHITEGRESVLRIQAAADYNYKVAEQKDKALTKAISEFKSSGGTLDFKTYQSMQENIKQQFDDIFGQATPENIFERSFADYVNNNISDAIFLGEEEQDSSELALTQAVTKGLKRQTTPYLMISKVLKDLEEDANETLANQGYFSWFVDIAKMAPPIIGQTYAELKLRDLVPSGFFAGGLLGENLDVQREKLFQMPVNDAIELIKKVYQRLRSDNPTLAQAWIRGLRGQTMSERFLNNLFTGSLLADIDVAFLIGRAFWKGGAKAVAEKKAKDVAKDVVETAAKTTGDLDVEVPAAAGQLEVGATAKASNTIIRNFRASNNPTRETLERLPTGLDKDATDLKANPSKLGQGFTNYLVDQYRQTKGALMEAALNISKVQRIPMEQITQKQLGDLWEEVKADFVDINSSILDLSRPAYNKITNNWYIDVALGKPGGNELFSSITQAQNWARGKGIEGAKVEKQGAGYYLRVSKHINEESNVMRDLLISDSKGKSPEYGLIRSLLGWGRTPEDTLSENAKVNRKIATYAQSEWNSMYNVIRRNIEDVKKGRVRFDPITGDEIPWYQRVPANFLYHTPKSIVTKSAKNRFERLERTLKANRTMEDEAGQQGAYFKGAGDLEDFYLRNFGEMPTPEETAAYFAVKRLNELDHAQRNIALFSKRARLGAKTIRIMTTDEAGKKLYSESFDAIRKLDFGGEETVLLMGEVEGRHKLFSQGEGSPAYQVKQMKLLREKIVKGELKLYEIFDPERRPLQEFAGIGDNRIRYIITKDAEESPLKFEQLPRRGGGHYEYDYDFYVKQARIRPERVGGNFYNWYEGDTTVMPIQIRAMGRDVAKRLDEYRLLLKAKKYKEAEAYARTNLPFEPKELRKWFNKKRGHLNLNEPFYVVPRNTSIIDLDNSLPNRYRYPDPKRPGQFKTTFKDGTKTGSAARQFQVEYTGERDAAGLRTVVDEGDAGRPLYRTVEAEMVDPIAILNRALSRITNSSFMDDIKISQMEAWVQEAAPFLDATDSELRHSPLWFFHHGSFKRGAQKEHLAEVQRLKDNNFKIRQFVGIPNKLDTFIHSEAQRMADQAWINKGPTGSKLTPPWLLHTVKDPFGAIRSMTYHFKLGVFAWPQIFVQGQTFTNIAALAPRSAVAGTYGAMLHQWSRMIPQHLDALDRYAAKLHIPGFHRWKPGEFKEANLELRKTGFGNVGGEYINLDAMAKYRLVRNSFQTFLDWGQVFFKEGEQNVRYGAWYTAFKEFRLKNPTKKITEAVRGEILQRADTLYTNMSRASASNLHTGPFSLTSQFLSYQMRLAELFWSGGSRLGMTRTERNLTRLRMLVANGLMYGVPVGVGVSGLPLQDYIRSQAFDNGYVVGDNWITSLVNEGVPALLAALATGEGSDFDEVLQTGNWYDVGSRYGSTGFEQLKDLMTGDKKFWELALGPAGNIVGNALFSSSKLVYGMFQFFYSNLAGIENPFPTKIDDFLDPVSDITSVSGLRRYIHALNTGVWAGRKGQQYTPPGSVSPENATFMTIFSLSPTEVGDAYRKKGMNAALEDEWKTARQEAERELVRSLEAASNNDYAEAQDRRKRALDILQRAGYPVKYLDSFIANTFKKSRSSIPREVDWEHYFKIVPEGEQRTRQDILYKLEQRRKARGQ